MSYECVCVCVLMYWKTQLSDSKRSKSYFSGLLLRVSSSQEPLVLPNVLVQLPHLLLEAVHLSLLVLDLPLQVAESGNSEQVVCEGEEKGVPLHEVFIVEVDRDSCT